MRLETTARERKKQGFLAIRSSVFALQLQLVCSGMIGYSVCSGASFNEQ